jgi:hypothetical protein
MLKSNQCALLSDGLDNLGAITMVKVKLLAMCSGPLRWTSRISKKWHRAIIPKLAQSVEHIKVSWIAWLSIQEKDVGREMKSEK